MADGPADGFVYAGIDEAGYGPRLGPLCVGCSVLRFEGQPEATPASPPPAWLLLRAGACKQARGRTDRRLIVNDSKAVLAGPPGGRAVGLSRLERSVRAFLACAPGRPRPDDDLGVLEALGVGAGLGDLPWYAGPARPGLPAGEALAAANLLARTLGQKRVRIERLACRALCERTFNERREALGNKAHANFEQATAHLRWIWDAFGDRSPFVAVDRQGGRSFYAGILRDAFPDADVALVAKGDGLSRYRLDGTGEARGRTVTIEFRVGADGVHFPTALASMVAKLVRELAMARFNDYWSRRAPGLRPTLGYGADANRWLDDAAGLLSESERRMLVRTA
ncbi:MAG: hypothetical protein ACF8QF_02810 [Phycisphaerales bacterium]